MFTREIPNPPIVSNHWGPRNALPSCRSQPSRGAGVMRVACGTRGNPLVNIAGCNFSRCGKIIREFVWKRCFLTGQNHMEQFDFIQFPIFFPQKGLFEPRWFSRCPNILVPRWRTCWSALPPIPRVDWWKTRSPWWNRATWHHLGLTHGGILLPSYA